MIRNLLQGYTWRRRRGFWLKIRFMEIFFPAGSIFSSSTQTCFFPSTTDSGKLFSKSTNVLSQCRQKVRKRMLLPLPAFFCSCELNSYCLAGMQGGEAGRGTTTTAFHCAHSAQGRWYTALGGFCFLPFWLG